MERGKVSEYVRQRHGEIGVRWRYIEAFSPRERERDERDEREREREREMKERERALSRALSFKTLS